MIGRAALLLAAALAVASSPARAQVESREGIALQNQILELRRDIQQMQAQGGGGGYASPSRPIPLSPPGGGGSSDLTASLLARVQTLEEQVRQLRGQLDETTNLTQRQGADLSKQIGDLSFRMGGAGGGGSSVPTSPPAASLGPAPGPAVAPGPQGRRTPENTLRDGYAALARRDYASSESAAREVLANRTSPRGTDAQFLLAESLAGAHNYPQAAIAYDDTYNRGRTGARAPEALLGLANSLTAINEKKAACDTLAKLGAEFPTRADLRPAEAAARGRAGCR